MGGPVAADCVGNGPIVWHRIFSNAAPYAFGNRMGISTFHMRTWLQAYPQYVLLALMTFLCASIHAARVVCRSGQKHLQNRDISHHAENFESDTLLGGNL